MSRNNLLTLLAGVLLVNEANPRGAAQAQVPDQSSTTDAGETTQAKIARALSAGPPEFAKSARVVDTDAQGKMTVLREGSNGFTCMPGNPKVIGDPPMCADAASMQWAADFKAHKPKPTNTVPGITYMLAGATQRSDTDPFDKTSPPIQVGPHWMDHVAVRSWSYRSTGHTQEDGCLHHVGRLALRSCACHGASVIKETNMKAEVRTRDIPHTYNRDGFMRADDNGGDSPNYEPNSFGGPAQDPRYRELPYKVSGDVNRYNHREGNDDYGQAGNLFRLMSPAEKQ